MSVRLAAEKVLEVGARDTEGPFWIEAEQRLGWVDIGAGRFHRFDPESGVDEAVDVGQPLGAAIPRRGGGFALAVQRGFAVLDPGSTAPRLVAEVDDQGGKLRFNDGKADPQGRFWAGSMAFDSTAGAGALYRLDPDLTVTRMVSGVTISNGLDWTADAATMYFVDSFAYAVDAFDFDPAGGAIANRRTVIPIPNDTASPAGFTVADGMTLDAEDHLWVAVYGSGELRRYSPAGALEAVIELPVIAVSSCAFGGPDYGDLYITTMIPGGRDGLEGEGALYRCRPGVRGRPPFAFAG